MATRRLPQGESDDQDPLVHQTPWGQLLRWQVPDLMHASGFRFATHVHSALTEQGVDLSYSHVHRLTTSAPERLTVDVQFALCRLFNCEPSDLWNDAGEVSIERPTQLDARARLKGVKPVRARNLKD
jgi:hypothetical protein